MKAYKIMSFNERIGCINIDVQFFNEETHIHMVETIGSHRYIEKTKLTTKGIHSNEVDGKSYVNGHLMNEIKLRNFNSEYYMNSNGAEKSGFFTGKLITLTQLLVIIEVQSDFKENFALFDRNHNHFVPLHSDKSILEGSIRFINGLIRVDLRDGVCKKVLFENGISYELEE